MAAPLWIRAMIAAVAVSVVSVHLVRTVRRRHAVPADAMHVVMAVAMVAMLYGTVAASPERCAGVAFGVAAAWWAARAVTMYVLDGVGGGVLVRADVAVGCAAMAYMLWVAAAPAPAASVMPGMAMSSGPATPTAVLLVSSMVFLAMITVVGRRRLHAEPAVLGCGVALDAVTALMLALA